METKWTPEPWKGKIFEVSKETVTSEDGTTFQDGIILERKDFFRASDCVNALAGIPDPKEFVEAARELFEMAWPVFRIACRAPFDSEESEKYKQENAILDKFKNAHIRAEKAVGVAP